MLTPLNIPKIYLIFLSLFLGWLFSLPVSAQKQPITILASEWSPYTSETLDSGGFLTEIAVTALTKAGYQTTLEFLPWKRALKLTKIGLSTALVGAYYSKERSHYFSYPEYSWKTSGQFFVHKNHHYNYQKIEDLCPAKLGIYAGSSYIKELGSIKCFEIQTVTTIQQNIKKLLNKRIDAFIETKESVLFYLKKDFPNQINKIVALSPAFKTNEIYIVFSKKSPNYQKIQADFDTAIKKMQADGSYENILKKHGIL